MTLARSLALPVAIACAAPLFANDARADGIVVARDEGAAARVAEAPVVLAKHRAEIDVRDGVAHVVVDQTFRNRTAERLEGDYLFPIPDGAVASHFAMTMGDRLVEGAVLPAAEARRVYESIVRRRRDPGLLEYAGRGAYRAHVFPIEPKGEVRVRLAYDQVLPAFDGTLEVRYPLATERLNGVPVEEASLEVSVEDAAPLTALQSPTHEVTVVREGGNKARVSWRREGFVADRDFVLYVGRGGEAVGLTVASHRAAGEDGTFLAVLSPRLETAGAVPIPKDDIFVLDTSGSMGGEKIAQGKEAVLRGISRLRPGDRFDVIAFASRAVPFRGAPVALDDAVRTEAREWVGRLQADGGTNIEDALREALARPVEGRLRVVVFVTDGRPTLGLVGLDSLVDVARSGAGAAHARVFTFGVGADLDVGLLDAIAEATGGAREYVADGAELAAATDRLYAQTERPVLTDVKIDFGPGVYDVYPQRVPDLYAGRSVVLFGRYREAGPRTARLTGNVAGKALALDHAVTLRAEPAAPFLPRLWAERKVAFLLDALRLHGRDAEVEAEVERLGTRHGLVTPFTSNLVTDDSELTGVSSGQDFGAGRGSRARWRGPAGSVPPGLRGPYDPPPPPAPTTQPPVTRRGDPSPPSPPVTIPIDPSPPPVTTPNQPPPTSDGPAASNRLRRRMEAGSQEAAGSSSAVRVVDDRAFARRADGGWVETTWKKDAKPRRIEAWSDDYLALLGKGDAVARILALGDHVLFTWEGEALEVVPAPAPAR